MGVRRIYVEKKPGIDARPEKERAEIRDFLQIKGIEKVRILNRYDVEGADDEIYARARDLVFGEPPVDILYEGTFPREEGDRVFSVEALPGQFDQRADSAVQCLGLLGSRGEPVIRCATTYCLSGDISDREYETIRAHYVNPVDSRLTDETVPDTLTAVYDVPEDVAVLEGFTEMSEEKARELYGGFHLAMTFEDFLYIRDYFREEGRDPSMTELRVFDTYWSDHCRHTTFQTELTDIRIPDGFCADHIRGTLEAYREAHNTMYAGRTDKAVCLMDMATLAAKQLKKAGKLQDQEESGEINACSLIASVDVDGKEEEWLISFKNETHNHPTEIEPFGGAATCLGGAIRDPLSGRSYVYQAMRVTGAADPRASAADTLPGKLPQRKIVTDAAHGYSSYGNQIGLATGHVREIYHPGYAAKRMEVGAVMGAAPRKNVIRMEPVPGDIILLLGGRTGRDGIGGATGSSKSHTASSIETCGAEVQKGNAPTERKLQRLFARPEASRLIKKCNDFGAGGVAVAIGELADGLKIDLDRVPKKYAGLDGTEIAISESQERMALVIAPGDLPAMLDLAGEENLEATVVAEVTEDPRLVMTWRGKTIVDIRRAFLDTNGVRQKMTVETSLPEQEELPSAIQFPAEGTPKERWERILSDLNVCSQQGLTEMFDSTVGAATVLMPYGGIRQKTPAQVMAAKIPSRFHETNTATLMAYGFDPYLSSWSPYHGAAYAVLTSVAKLAAAGGDWSRVRFSFQEYFGKPGTDPARWGSPVLSLLGAYEAQMGLGLPSIGGKDSMSGSFDEMDVPPTLISFAVGIGDARRIISPEFKKAGSLLVLYRLPEKEDFLPDWKAAGRLYTSLHQDIADGNIVSAWALERFGMAEALAKMAAGSGLGAKISGPVPEKWVFGPGFGNILAEVPEDRLPLLHTEGLVVGEVTEAKTLSYLGEEISLTEAMARMDAPLSDVYPQKASSCGEQTGDSAAALPLYTPKEILICRHRTARPRVFIPAFPGTNCEIDSAQAMERAGAVPDVRVMRNLTAADIEESVRYFAEGIAQAQIVMFPGGFSAGDEPDGSAKFFAAMFRNERLKEEIDRLLQDRDGLMLGICNGFQALIKLGLVPYGRIGDPKEDDPTLTFNTIGRHISRMNYVRVASTKSPWLAQTEAGGIYVNPASHGEGRFIASAEWLSKLAENGQIATQYCAPDGTVSTDPGINTNGSSLAVEGITSPDGRVFGKMLHCERSGRNLHKNIYGEQDMRLFASGVSYFA